MASIGSCGPMATPATSGTPTAPVTASSSPVSAVLLDFFFPGMSMFTGALQRHLHIDLSLYFIPVMLFGCATVVWQYLSRYLYTHIETHFMSTVEVRYDDEVYNMLMTWVICQPFSRRARHFVVNTVVGSRSWSVMEMRYANQRRRYYNDDVESEDDEDLDADEGTGETGTGEGTGAITTTTSSNIKKNKALSYTPSFGQYYFWFRGHVIIFNRTLDEERHSDRRETVSLTCLGRNPAILKELLFEARRQFLKHDAQKTVIYRGSDRSNHYPMDQPSWARCMARSPRPMSTVILNDKVKADLVTDITDYLDPTTRRWYANRGIPYRRGYLLYGPPGTGKSSLSVSLAGYFHMNIYIVSLNGRAATEDSLSTLFNSLPRRCIVLLEDIDTAGLTHTREDGKAGGADDDDESSSDSSGSSDSSDNDRHRSRKTRDSIKTGRSNTKGKEQKGRISLSGLLNILDGVASQEGRILIMTTNHMERLDKALIRPGRVDMMVKFDRSDQGMTAALFRSIFAPLEGDFQARKTQKDLKDLKEKEDRKDQGPTADTFSLETLAAEFAERIPELTFSPAELQGFLLKHKRDPVGAVAAVESWVKETQEAKAEQVQRAEKKAERKKAREEARKARRARAKAKAKAKKAKAKAKARKDESDSEEEEEEDKKERKERKERKEKEKKEVERMEKMEKEKMEKEKMEREKMEKEKMEKEKMEKEKEKEKREKKCKDKEDQSTDAKPVTSSSEDDSVSRSSHASAQTADTEIEVATEETKETTETHETHETPVA